MKIVTESSAVIPGHRSTLLDADHQNMCKFRDREDLNYKRVSGLLAKWTKELGKAQEVANEQNASLLP